MSFGKFTIGLEGGRSRGIPNSSSISSDDRSKSLLLSEEESEVGTGDGTGEEDGGLGVAGSIEIGLGRGITGDDKGCEDTVCEVDGCRPKI